MLNDLLRMMRRRRRPKRLTWPPRLDWLDRNPAQARRMAEAAARLAKTTGFDDAVEHALTVVSDPALVERLQAAFRGVDALYIADGHHRSAAASRIHAARATAHRDCVLLE